METPFEYRYGLYETYSKSQQNWFQWIYDQIQVFPSARILDMGSGHGNLWIRKKDVKFIFLRQDVKRNFVFQEKYDRIVANHLWDFIADKDTLMEKAKNALNCQGFMLSTYSSYGFMEVLKIIIQRNMHRMVLRGKRWSEGSTERLRSRGHLRF